LTTQASIATPAEIDGDLFDIENFWVRFNYGTQRNTKGFFNSVLDVFSAIGGFYTSILGTFATFYAAIWGKKCL